MQTDKHCDDSGLQCIVLSKTYMYEAHNHMAFTVTLSRRSLT